MPTTKSLSHHYFRPKTPINWTLYTLSGTDATDFLHRLSTVDAKALPIGHIRRMQRTFFLNHKGQAAAYFFLTKLSETEYTIELDAGREQKWEANLLNFVDQFTFGEDIHLEKQEDRACLWVFSPEMNGNTLPPGTQLTFLSHGEKDFGTPWLSIWGKPSELEQWAENHLTEWPSLSYPDLQIARIQALTPWIDSEITETTLPLEVGLPDSISRDKGCYPGQEVIERIYTYGSPPRRLVQFRATGEGAPKELFSPQDQKAKLGNATTIVQNKGGETLGMAILRKMHAKEGTPFCTEEGVKGEITRVSTYE